MDSRRDFLKKASVLATGAGLMGSLPASIQKALAINPAAGSTFLDAEHIVILMQENRSFDHCYGTLQGVRGFNDPRAIRLPNRNKVWLQTDKQGNTFAPFRLDMKGSNATWLHSLPHSWEDQVDARNKGWHNRWLQAKQTGLADYKHIPLTLGYYNREDIPFYYALADAFTVCDQHFCSSLTGTTPNRLYLWSGTAREQPDFNTKANVKNEDVDYGKWAKWKSFPERLEEQGISWRIYQNEISLPSGLAGEKDALLANFTDNPIEWFENYQVKYHPEYRQYLLEVKDSLPGEIAKLEEKIKTLSGTDLSKAQKELSRKKEFFETAKKDLELHTPENFAKLSDFQKNIHQKAFTNNRKDPHYRELSTFEYQEKGGKRSLELPKGDIFHQFRQDVEGGTLPTVSWLVAPEKFSDHPTAPWYGAWYVSETLDILTQNPEVWKKTIFILTYDENDGYYDHVPPFIAPNHEKPDTGKVSTGIDASVERVNIVHEKQRAYRDPEKQAREDAIGLGFRVPMVIASPWSRGGQVCSEVFDHTSVVQFLEGFLSAKTKKGIVESNISAWRRTVCGDLTSAFKPYNGENIQLPSFVDKEPFIKGIFEAQYQGKPANFKAFSDAEIARINQGDPGFDWGGKQEKGIRKSCPLSYELYAEGVLKQQQFELQLKVGNSVFGKKSNGSPFIVYNSKPYQNAWPEARNYAVKAGDTLTDTWEINGFEDNIYHLELYGPNGFYRAFQGDLQTTQLETALTYEAKNKGLTGNVILELKNKGSQSIQAVVEDLAYKTAAKTLSLAPNNSQKLRLDLQKSHHWYDFVVKIVGNSSFERRYAGHVETGAASFTDPAMGGVMSA
ncbi:phosphocholine-specific phospholipase C [Haliscomenobacter sp.]|uniref:phosphocholine-specific phospholipase C n=1 Tax=Haliscomenobacter sp. TaxID=2717303 RepID=UPI003BAC3A5C